VHLSFLSRSQSPLGVPGRAWESGGTSWRAALRGFLGPGNSYYDIGFRVARSDPSGDK
jgi:hypothetical protein